MADFIASVDNLHGTKNTFVDLIEYNLSGKIFHEVVPGHVIKKASLNIYRLSML